MRSASPTSKGCTTNSKMTELNKFMMELLKEKDRATMMEDMVSHTLVRSTYASHVNINTPSALLHSNWNPKGSVPWTLSALDK